MKKTAPWYYHNIRNCCQLDLQAELHLKSDRVAIAYRTWLRQLGLTFGTA